MGVSGFSVYGERRGRRNKQPQRSAPKTVNKSEQSGDGEPMDACKE